MYFKIFISKSWDKRAGISPKESFRGARQNIPTTPMVKNLLTRLDYGNGFGIQYTYGHL